MASAPLLSAVQALTAPGVHRGAVLEDEPTELIGILSQSTILKKTLPKLIETVPDLLAKTVAELNLGTKDIISVTTGMQVIKAMELIHMHKITAVAIVDPVSGALFGNISVSDIKAVFKARGYALLKG